MSNLLGTWDIMPNSSVEKCCNTTLLLNYWLVRSPETSQVSPQFWRPGFWGCRFRDLTRTEVYACPSISIQTDSSTQCQRFFFLWRVFFFFFNSIKYSHFQKNSPKIEKKFKKIKNRHVFYKLIKLVARI